MTPEATKTHPAKGRKLAGIKAGQTYKKAFRLQAGSTYDPAKAAEIAKGYFDKVERRMFTVGYAVIQVSFLKKEDNSVLGTFEFKPAAPAPKAPKAPKAEKPAKAPKGK